MYRVLMLSTILLNVFAAATAALFITVGSNLPASAGRFSAITMVVLIAVTLLNVRVRRTILAHRDPDETCCRVFRIASQIVPVIAWGAMAGALVAIHAL